MNGLGPELTREISQNTADFGLLLRELWDGDLYTVFECLTTNHKGDNHPRQRPPAQVTPSNPHHTSTLGLTSKAGKT